MPGSVDLAILGTLWLLVVVALSAPAWVSGPAALTVYAVHSALLIRAEGLNPLTLSELKAAGYICAAFLIAAAVLRPTIAVHVSLAARRASLASRSAAESAAAEAIGQERQSRLAVLEKEALPLLRGIADGTLDPTAGDVGTGAPGTPPSSGTPSPAARPTSAISRAGSRRHWRPLASEGCW